MGLSNPVIAFLEKTIKVQAVSRINLLNYEYLMLQSFIDPFFSELIFHVTESKNFDNNFDFFRSFSDISDLYLLCIIFCEGSTYELASIIRNFHIRVSPSFVHTMTVAQYLWNSWSKNVEFSRKITAPYLISNNTNHMIE